MDAITVTLDSHQRYDIAHPAFWQQGNGDDSGDVAPFTAITAAQVRAGCSGHATPRRCSAAWNIWMHSKPTAATR